VWRKAGIWWSLLRACIVKMVSGYGAERERLQADTGVRFIVLIACFERRSMFKEGGDLC
jgi:hypothetical protein